MHLWEVLYKGEVVWGLKEVVCVYWVIEIWEYFSVERSGVLLRVNVRL
jgi:hypothetical protein